MRIPDFSTFVNERLGFPTAVGPMAKILTKRMVEYVGPTVTAVVKDMKAKPALHEFIRLDGPDEFPLAAVELIGSYEVGYPVEPRGHAIAKEDGGPNFRPWVSGEFAGTYAGALGLTARITLTVQTSLWHVQDDPRWAENMRAEIESAAAHELTHAFEAHQREKHHTRSMTLSKDGTFDLGSRAARGMVADVPDALRDTFANLFFIQYLCASYEVNARAAAVLPYLDGKEGADRLAAIKASPMWDEASQLLAFSAAKTYDQLVDHYESDDRLAYFMRKLDASFTETVPRLMTTFSFDDDSTLNRDERARALDYFRGHDAKRVSSIANKTPRAFLSYWEKRAHRTGEDLRRRLLRTASY